MLLVCQSVSRVSNCSSVSVGGARRKWSSRGSCNLSISLVEHPQPALINVAGRPLCRRASFAGYQQNSSAPHKRGIQSPDTQRGPMATSRKDNKAMKAASPAQEGAPQEQWSAEHYASNCRFVADLAMQPLMDLLAPKQEERILDLGCGDGPLMGPIAAYGCKVVGVDYSEDMILKAQARGLDARVADGQALAFEHEFDAVFTNAALHWMKRDPDAVISGVRRALKQGGRFVGEFGGHGNVAAIKTALFAVCNAHGFEGVSRDPWYFPTVDEYRARLEAQGFEVGYIELIPRPTPLPTGMAEWFAAFGQTFFEGMDEQTKKEAVAEGLALLKPSLCDHKGNWTADYVRLRFAARVPA